MSRLRLQSALSKAGVISRRKAASVIESGRVKVNGEVACEKGLRVDTLRDEIRVDGRVIPFEITKHYYILNKPAGVVSTVDDERGRKKVSDYVKKINARLYPVGRLDKDTTGLIILTNDGDLTYRLTHPRFAVDRVYEATIKGVVREKDLRRFKRGIMIEGKLARAEKVVFKKKTRDFAVVLVLLREGKKRQVRNMFKALRLDVLKLKRISYGPLKLGDLKEGKVRPLTGDEVRRLKLSTM